MVLAAAAALLVGSLGGLINGILVAYGRLQPIIVTLATGSIWTGIALYIRPSPGGFIPLDFSNLLSSTAFSDPVPLPFGLTWGIPIPKAAFVILGLVIFWLVFRRSRLATRIYAVGSSEGAAYLSGVNVQRAKLAAYTLAGFAAGCAGLVNSAQTATGNALSGTVFTLNSIAAVVLGGASLAAGAGSVSGHAGRSVRDRHDPQRAPVLWCEQLLQGSGAGLDSALRRLARRYRAPPRAQPLGSTMSGAPRTDHLVPADSTRMAPMSSLCRRSRVRRVARDG